jgi:hypothetical protein
MTQKELNIFLLYLPILKKLELNRENKILHFNPILTNHNSEFIIGRINIYPKKKLVYRVRARERERERERESINQKLKMSKKRIRGRNICHT